MNTVTKKLILMVAPTLIESVIESIFNEKVLTGFRDDVIMFLRETADKTVTEIDDALVEHIVETIMTPGKYVEHTRRLCEILRKYIQDNQVAWDDVVILPILDRIELIGMKPPEETPEE